MRRFAITALVAFLGTFVAAPATSQTAQTISIQGSLLGAAFGGDTFETDGLTFEPGTGGEVQIRWNPSALSVGLGVQYTSHAITLQGFEEIDININFAGVFLEPRYVIFVGSERFAPYLSARIMRLVSTLEIPEINASEELDSWGFNGGGGLLIRLNSRANVDVGLTGGTITFVYDDGTTETGNSYVFRVGLALGV